MQAPIKTAFLLAAGFGTRLKPLTAGYPKPLLFVRDKPLIIAHIEKLVQAGITHVLINLHYQGGCLRSSLDFYLQRMTLPSAFQLTFLEEDEIRGTGGALVAAQSKIQEERFYLINADMVYAGSFNQFRPLGDHALGLAVMVLKKEVQPHLRQVLMDAENRICNLGPVCLRKNASSAKFGFIGIQMVHRRIFEYLSNKTQQCIIRDVYVKAASMGETVYGFETNTYWNEIGDLDQLATVTRDILDKKF